MGTTAGSVQTQRSKKKTIASVKGQEISSADAISRPTRAPGRNKRSEETITQILSAAEQVILESGVDRVAIQDVCHVAGISRGTFYRYFSSQEELLDAFSKHKRARFHLALHAATTPYSAPDERFNALIAYLDNYLKHSKARRLLEVAPEFAFGFFKRIFHDSIDRFQEVLGIVFDDWDAKLGVRLDRALICEMLIRYVLSELLVPREGDRRQLLTWIAQLSSAILRGGDPGLQPNAPRHVRAIAANTAGGDTAGREPGRNRRSEGTIREILVATEKVILESGVDRVSILTVCETAGISRGTFYRYFSSQEELLDAFTQHKRTVFHQALLDATDHVDDPDERFAALISHLDRFLEQTKARRLLLVAPEYAFGFFKRAFLDSIDRFQDALKIVFDAWEARLKVKLDRELICEMLIRYVLSELLVQGEGDRRQLPERIGRIIASIGKTKTVPGRVSKETLLEAAADVVILAPREPGRNSRSDQTIQRILAAAEQVILESGVDRVSILNVCDVAGVSRGTFYRYFSSQEELLDAFAKNQRAQFHDSLIAVAGPGGNPDQRLQSVMKHLEQFIRLDKVRRLLKVAPEYAIGFFERMFQDAIDRYQSVLDTVFDAWDVRLGIAIDRPLACELLVRYVLSELLVPSEIDKPLVPVRLGSMLSAIVIAKSR